MSWSTSELRVRLARRETSLSPPVKYFYWPFQGGISFVDHLCYLCFVFVMLSRLFIAALWSPEGKGLANWLLFVIFIVILLLSHLVSWDRCGTWLYRFMILAVFLTLSFHLMVIHKTISFVYSWILMKLIQWRESCRISLPHGTC